MVPSLVDTSFICHFMFLTRGFKNCKLSFQEVKKGIFGFLTTVLSKEAEAKTSWSCVMTYKQFPYFPRVKWVSVIGQIFILDIETVSSWNFHVDAFLHEVITRICWY